MIKMLHIHLDVKHYYTVVYIIQFYNNLDDNKILSPLSDYHAVFVIHYLLYLSLDRGCTSKQGWQPRKNFLDSGINQADDVYMSLRLSVKGFGGSERLNDPRQGQHGLVTFDFEMICNGDCTFKFKEVNFVNILLLIVIAT